MLEHGFTPFPEIGNRGNLSAITSGDAEFHLALHEVSELRGVDVQDILGRSRLPKISHARQEVFSRLRSAGFKLEYIACLFERDYKTISYGIEAHRRRAA